MTFLEKLRKDRPKKKIPKSCWGIGCPSQYGYEKVFEECGITDCRDCWNREMPNTEPKVAITEDDLKLSYDKGLNDAWELARKIWDEFTLHKLEEIFGYDYTKGVIDNYTPQEALAKLKAYEEQSEIKVGDVVDFPSEGRRCCAVVTCIVDDYLYGFAENGLLVESLQIDNCKKTGKHIDIQSILEQIRDK